MEQSESGRKRLLTGSRQKIANRSRATAWEFGKRRPLAVLTATTLAVGAIGAVPSAPVAAAPSVPCPAKAQDERAAVRAAISCGSDVVIGPLTTETDIARATPDGY